MRQILSPILLALALGSTGNAAVAGTAVVTFGAIEDFTDVGNSPSEIKDNVAALAQHVERLAARRLGPDDVLHVDILDLDLAGQIRRTGRYFEEVRIIDGKVDGPVIRLAYRLERGGTPVAEGRATLSEPNYLRHRTTYAGSDILRHEKPLLDRWFHLRCGGEADH